MPTRTNYHRMKHSCKAEFGPVYPRDASIAVNRKQFVQNRVVRCSKANVMSSACANLARIVYAPNCLTLEGKVFSKLVRRYEVLIFLCLIVVANTIFVVACAEGILPDSLYNYGRFALLISVMVLVIYVSRGSSALIDLVRMMTRWRIAPEWYLLAASWAFLLSIIVLSGRVMSGGVALEDLMLQLDVVTNPRILLTLLIGALIGEIVWISYSIKKLAERQTIFVASLIVGTFWTAWWFPMALYDYGIIPGLNLLPLWINQTGVALMCGLIYFHTRSALCVLILQIGVNTSILILPVLPTTGGETTYWVFSVTYFLAAVLAHLYLGPRPLLSADHPETATASGPGVPHDALPYNHSDQGGHLGVLKPSIIRPRVARSISHQFSRLLDPPSR